MLPTTNAINVSIQERGCARESPTLVVETFGATSNDEQPTVVRILKIHVTGIGSPDRLR